MGGGGKDTLASVRSVIYMTTTPPHRHHLHMAANVDDHPVYIYWWVYCWTFSSPYYQRSAPPYRTTSWPGCRGFALYGS